MSIKIFYSHQRICGVNFKKIDNGPHFTTISAIAVKDIFKKNLKLVCNFFVVIHNIHNISKT